MRDVLNKESIRDRSFAAFAQAVRESCESHAQRKNYTTEGIDGENQLLNVCVMLGIHKHHAIGEIIYKSVEFLKTPRRVLLEKISGWAFVLWKETPEP